MAADQPAGAVTVAPQAGSLLRPRGELFITGEDNLRVTIVNALVGVVVTIAGRVYDPVAGVIIPFHRTITPASNRTATTAVIPLGSGFVLDLTAYASTGAPLSGQTYVVLTLVRGLSGPLVQLAMLAGDYITSVQALCWPGSSPKSSIVGEPYVRAISGTTPGAGVEITETCPTGARWCVVSFLAGFVASAAGVDRQMILQHHSSAIVRAESVAIKGVPPSGSGNLTWAPGLTDIADASGTHFSSAWIADNRLIAGDTLKTSTNNIQPGDQWTAPFYVVREWLEVP